MPIPDFDLVTNILPPFLESPTSSNKSPYRCLFADVESRLGLSAERLEILDGFGMFRAELRSLGITGFQWLDGSFVENCEVQKGKPPGDIDVVTFIDAGCSLEAVMKVIQDPRFNSPLSKQTFHTDSYFIYQGDIFRTVIRSTAYWYGLFSHRRDDFLWKGMLEIPLQLSDQDLFSLRSGS